jgi:hypothetical protein
MDRNFPDRPRIAIVIVSTLGHKHCVSRLEEIITSFGRSYGPIVRHSVVRMKDENISLVNKLCL